MNKKRDNDMTQKTTILLVHDLYTGNAKAVTCGATPYDNAVKYIKSFNTYANIPDDCCLTNLRAVVHQSFDNSMEITKNCIYQDKKANAFMQVHYNLGADSKCDRYSCLENIKTGKCRDEFVIKNIGLRFFADKYKEKTK